MGGLEEQWVNLLAAALAAVREELGMSTRLFVLW
jgi:hypothetical protein